MLKPELQDLEIFVDGMDNIVSTQKRVAEHYFNDGTVELACPPLKALLHVMAYGQYEGRDLQCREIRGLFTREALLCSDWYRHRLAAKQQVDIVLWERHVNYLERYLRHASHADEEYLVTIEDRLIEARAQLARAKSDNYQRYLDGTIGAEPAVARLM